MREKVKEDVHRILNACLEGSDQSFPLPKGSKSNREEGSPHSKEDEYYDYDQDKRKGCSFKYFMGCKPEEYHGSFEPKVTTC